MIILLLILLLLSSCTQPNTRFTEVSASANVENVNQLQPTEDFNIITYLYYYNGGGVAATDINGDGLADLYFTNNQQPNRYYINEGNWQFRDATKQAGVMGKGDWSNGVSVVDVNQDGLMDIYVCNVSGYLGLSGGNELFIQQTDGTFDEQSQRFGLDFEGFATQAYWLDYDDDGDLDCYLLTHSVHNDATYGAARFRERPDSIAGDRLYECVNNEDGPFYKLVSQDGSRRSNVNKAGIYSSKIGYGLSAAVADFNQDKRPDIYVCNDFSENDYLYLNTGKEAPVFKESIRKSMGHSSNFSMGSTVGDFDNDGRPDLFTLDMRPADQQILKHTASADPYNVYQIKRDLGYYDQFPRNNLQWNRGQGRFSEIGQMAGVAASDWSWSALAADFDLDGKQDIFVTNGIMRRPNDLDYLKFISSQNASNISNLELSRQMPDGRVANVLFQNQGDLQFENVATSWGLDHTGSSNGSAYADLDQDGDLDLVVNNLNEAASLYRNNTVDHSAIGNLETNEKADQVARSGSFWSSPQQGMLSQSSMSSSASNHLVIDDNAYGLFATSLVEIALKENQYTDFDTDPLQPYALSDEGPAVAKGIVANREVIYIGGAHGQRMRLREDYPDLPLLNYKQSGGILADSLFEDVDAIFFDADEDGDDDLYVVSGGGQTNTPLKYFKDRLYLQEAGQFKRCRDCIPDELVENGSCVTAGDFDRDGDQDLFVGGSVQPGQYGAGATTFILLNQGNGHFIKDEKWMFDDLGILTDVIWQAETNTLIICGSWLPIRSISKQEGEWQIENISMPGLWRCLTDTGDGGFLAGNWGLNSVFGHPDEEHPLRLYVGDFDRNGKVDPIITLQTPEREITLADKDELSAQLPAWRKNNLAYSDFATQDFATSFKDFPTIAPLFASELRSGTFTQATDGKYDFIPFGRSFQLTAINNLSMINGELWVAGNELNVLPRIGRQDAAALQVLKQDRTYFVASQLARGQKILKTTKGHIIAIGN